MFYSHSLLSRKGPLGTIWIAAYCFKKLKREQISTTDISSSVDKIMPEVHISHRVLAQLLLGIVKIFSKQVDYLYDECNQALNQIRISFSPSKWTTENMVSIRTRKAINGGYEETSNPNYKGASKKRHTIEQRIQTLRASYNEVTITLPEIFDLDSLKLRGLDEGDVGKPDEHCIPQVELIDGKSDRTPFSNECLPAEVVCPSEYNSTCFSPLADVLPSSTVDIDLELSEACNTIGFTSGQKNLQYKEESENLDGSTGNMSPRLEDDEMPELQNSLNVQGASLLDRDKGKILQEKNDHLKPISSPGEKISEHVKADGFSANASSSDKIHPGLKLSGTTSPKFGLITPAIQEKPRSSRKRKKSYDQDIMLSNEIMRQSIHDASDLVSKRRKCPHTVLDAWKFRKLLNFGQSLMEPLIPFAVTSSKWLPQKKQHSDLSKKSAEGHTFPAAKKEKRLKKCSQSKKEDLKQIPDSNMLSPLASSELRENSCENFSKEHTSLDPEFQFEMMELDSHKDVDDHQDHGCSVNTRAAAQYLCKRFLKARQKGKEETLSLVQILEGKQRTECARFFYEILTLKTSSCIDVKQDFPYSDVFISATSLLECFLGIQA